MQEMIYITDISIAIEISKAMKLEYYIWKINELGEIYEVLSTPKEIAYICKAQYNSNAIRSIPSATVFLNKETLMRMSEMFSKLPPTKVILTNDVILAEDYPENVIGVNRYIQFDENIHSIPSDVVLKIYNIENLISPYLYLNNIDFGDITNHPTIQQLLSIKIDAGLIRFVPDNIHIMGVYKGMISLNKSDKVYLKIYDHPIQDIFLSEFTVVKKKAIKLVYYISFISLIRQGYV